MPGLNVRFHVFRSETGLEVKYQPAETFATIPLLSRNSSIIRSFTVKAKGLGPEHDCRHDLLHRTKAAPHPSNTPTYAFRVICSLPESITLVDPMTFDVQIEPDSDESRVTTAPDIILGENFSNVLVAYTAACPMFHGLDLTKKDRTWAS